MSLPGLTQVKRQETETVESCDNFEEIAGEQNS